MNSKFSYTIQVAEGKIDKQKCTGAEFIAARMIMDACLAHDVFLIQLILERLDGTPPSDEAMDGYTLQFSDILNFYLSLDQKDKRNEILNEDTTLVVLAKELLACAAEPIYMHGRPKADVKREHSTAVKMVLERSGGKKSRLQKASDSDEITVKDWVKTALPSSDQL